MSENGLTPDVGFTATVPRFLAALETLDCAGCKEMPSTGALRIE